MSIPVRNRSIARLIVGAMTIEGAVGPSDRNRLAESLRASGLDSLIADVGIALEDVDSNFNLFEECRILRETLGAEAPTLTPILFRIICDAIATDRFVSEQEATYLSALAKKLELPTDKARKILTEVLYSRKSRIEAAGSSIDEVIHPHLKSLMTFEGAEDLVGPIDPNSIEALIEEQQASGKTEQATITELHAALGTLGLTDRATLEDAKTAWREILETTNLSKLSDAGDAFVSAAIDRLSKMHAAFVVIRRFHETVH